MDIFESLENLNVSEECFNDIVGLVEKYIQEEDVYEPEAYKKDGYNFIANGRNKNNGQLYRTHSKHNKGVDKNKFYASSPEEAVEFISKQYKGSPKSAHSVIGEKYEDEYTDAPSGHKHKVGDDVQVHFGAGLDGGKSGKIASLYKNHNGHTWAKGSGDSGEFDVPTSYLRVRKTEK